MNFCLAVVSFMILLVFQGNAGAVTVKDAVYITKNAGKVVFSHSDHITQKSLANNCRACHDAIFDIKKKKRFTMKDMERGYSCGACHNGKQAFSISECSRCHPTKEVIFKVTATGPTVFSHKAHSAKHPNCSSCHPAIFTTGPNKRFTMADMKKGKSCGACHNGKKAFGIDACTACHPVRDITYQVKQTGPTRFSHTKHIEAHSCSDCHTRLYPVTRQARRYTMAQMDKGGSCGACHNGKGAFPLKECASCHPVKDILFPVKVAGDATFSHSKHIGLYRCEECHVKLYQTHRASKPVSMQEMEDKKMSCGACHDGSSAFSVKEKCGTCHKMSH